MTLQAFAGTARESNPDLQATAAVSDSDVPNPTESTARTIMLHTMTGLRPTRSAAHPQKKLEVARPNV